VRSTSPSRKRSQCAADDHPALQRGEFRDPSATRDILECRCRLAASALQLIDDREIERGVELDPPLAKVAGIVARAIKVWRANRARRDK